MSFNIHEYLERIGLPGNHPPNEETLRRLHWHHVTTFPFENISVLLGLPIHLDAAGLAQKMVRGGRGGYCFEQNLLFSHALQALGFAVTGLSARVLPDRTPGMPRARTHMLLHVVADGVDYVADTGFGGMTLTEPIRLQPRAIQVTSHERRRIMPGDDEFIMQAQVRGQWNDLYRFDLRPSYLSDYEVANWYVSTNPASHFVRWLTAARPTAEGRYTLRHNEFAHHSLDGNTERRTLTSPAELRSVLEDTFQLRLPGDPKLDEMLERVVRPAAGEEAAADEAGETTAAEAAGRQPATETTCAEEIAGGAAETTATPGATTDRQRAG